MPDGQTRRHRHKVTRDTEGVQIHVRIDDQPREKRPSRRGGKRGAKAAKKPTAERLDSFAAAFAAKSMEERILAHKKSMLLAFESIEMNRPKSIQPVCRSTPKTVHFTLFEPDPPAIPAFVLDDYVKYMQVEQAADRDPPSPLRRTYEPRAISPKKNVKLKRLSRPQSAHLPRDHARISSRLRQEIHDARTIDSMAPPKPQARRPQTAKDRPLTPQGTVELELERLMSTYQSKFQPYMSLRLDKTWARPCARPTPLHHALVDDDGLPQFSLDFQGVDLKGGGIPGFQVETPPSLSLTAFVPHILLCVDLSFANLTDAGCYPIATQLIHEPSIIALNVSGNPITLVGVEVLLEAVKCRALFHAIDSRLPPVEALYMHEMPCIDVNFVTKLVELADLSLALTRDAAVVAVAHEQLMLELESADDDSLGQPSQSAPFKATPSAEPNHPPDKPILPTPPCEEMDQVSDVPETREATVPTRASPQRHDVRPTSRPKPTPQQQAKQREKVRRATRRAVEATAAPAEGFKHDTIKRGKSTGPCNPRPSPSKKTNAPRVEARNAKVSSDGDGSVDTSAIVQKVREVASPTPTPLEEIHEACKVSTQLDSDKRRPSSGSHGDLGCTSISTTAKAVVNEAVATLMSLPIAAILFSLRARTPTPTDEVEAQLIAHLVHSLHAPTTSDYPSTPSTPAMPTLQYSPVAAMAKQFVDETVGQAIQAIHGACLKPPASSGLRLLAKATATTAIGQGLRLASTARPPPPHASQRVLVPQ